MSPPAEICHIRTTLTTPQGKARQLPTLRLWSAPFGWCCRGRRLERGPRLSFAWAPSEGPAVFRGCLRVVPSLVCLFLNCLLQVQLDNLPGMSLVAGKALSSARMSDAVLSQSSLMGSQQFQDGESEGEEPYAWGTPEKFLEGPPSIFRDCSPLR